ncbi:MAG: SDR family oxidoreductase [Clostridiaceae bacterium]|nr:SDR family oxidoreductase [Clostridiaceae bacterium]
MEFKDKVIVVTGASEGVGRECVQKLMCEGATVYGVARRQSKLDILQSDMDAQGFPGKLITMSCDVSKKDQVEKLFETVKNNEGGLDALVSNAAVMDKFAPITEISEDDFDWIMDINVKGNFYLFQAAIPVMNENGSIVVTTSIAGIRGGKAGVAYTVSKHAVIGMVRNTACMYADTGIRVNAVAPGGIDTPMTQGISAQMAEMSQAGLGVIGTGASMKKMMASADEIADNLVFLISDKARNINGHVLVSDFGLTQK